MPQTKGKQSSGTAKPRAKGAGAARPKVREPARAETAPAPAGTLPEREIEVGPPEPSPELRGRIAEAAYYRAQRRGFAPGREMEDWLEAEREVGGAVPIGETVRSP